MKTCSAPSFPRRRESIPNKPLDPRLCGDDKGGMSF